MQTVRYGVRSQQENREIEAKKADIWSEAVTAVYETDPEIVAGYVLSRFREPAPEVDALVDRARDAAAAIVLGEQEP